MMDVDDGYILWTGIWKGKLVPFSYTSISCVTGEFFAPSYSPREFKRLAIFNCHCGTWLTRVWYAPADIVKMIESQPDLASQIRRVRGGYLKIQGTWMPYEVF
jgi:hypothetical protein